MLVFHFIKSNGSPTGIRLINCDDHKIVYESSVADSQSREDPWAHLMHKMFNYVSRVYPKKTVILPLKQECYISKLCVQRTTKVSDFPKGVKKSLVHYPMVYTTLRSRIPLKFMTERVSLM